MAREAHPLLRPAEQALAARLAARVNLHGKGYCYRPEDNLIDTVTCDPWDAAMADIEKGRGAELASKFLAAYSSSALAVNAFAPLRGHVALPDGLDVEGETHFEQGRSAWPRGWWPTLDVTVERKSAPVRLFVESKCIEFLRKSATDFSAAFPKKASEHLEPEAAAVFETVFDDRHAFDPLDAAQLLKHFLAAKQVALAQQCRVVLMCVWWEPTDTDTHPVYGSDPTHARPWEVQLANGKWCSAFTGATSVIGGMGVSYGCTGGGILLDKPRRTVPAWSIFYARSYKAKQFTAVPIRSAWW